MLKVFLPKLVFERQNRSASMKPALFFGWVPVLALLVSAPAFAHSELKQTIPRDGEVVLASPDVFDMIFAEPVQLTLVQIKDSAERDVILPDRRDLHPRNRETIRLPALSPGLWRVQWRAISADGHPVGGVIRFTIRPEGKVAQ